MAANTPNLPPPAPRAVSTNTVAASDIRDAKPPVPIPNPWTWLIWALVLALAAAIAFYAWRRWRRRPATIVAERLIPPHVRARERLLAALALLDQPEPFVVAVSGALRDYLEERFQLQAPERTTEEFLAELQDSEILDADQKLRLADFLQNCDLVKFARHEPTEVELRALHDSACRFVDQTEPSPLAPTIPG